MKIQACKLCLIMSLFAGCVHVEEKRVLAMSLADLELIEAVLRNDESLVTYRHDPHWTTILYLTPTRLELWRDGIEDMPDELHARIADLSRSYRKASQAILHDRGGHWEISGSGSRCDHTMRWVSILLWVNYETAIVYEGEYFGPLAGRGSTYVWKKENGRWEAAIFLSGWDS